MTYEIQKKIELLKRYYSGLKDGVQMYAHWKDGEQYVGTTGRTLRSAIVELNKEEEGRIAQLLQGASV